jgi:hypothetical protein
MNARRWKLLAACFAFGTPFLPGLLLSFVSTTSSAGTFAFLFVMLALVGYLSAGFICIWVGIAQASNGRWGAALQCAIVPAIIATFVAFPGTYKRTLVAADYIHFAAFSLRYKSAVDAAPRTNGPRLLWFFWVDASAPLAGETLVFLVFDESDEFALPDAQRTAAWKARALSGFMKATGFVGGPEMPDKAHCLIGHYYVIRMNY